VLNTGYAVALEAGEVKGEVDGPGTVDNGTEIMGNGGVGIVREAEMGIAEFKGDSMEFGTEFGRDVVEDVSLIKGLFEAFFCLLFSPGADEAVDVLD
jgi:hypothetical protein